jgi:hypothetical protein
MIKKDPGNFHVSRRLIDLAKTCGISARGMLLWELEDLAPDDAVELWEALFDFRLEIERALVRMGNVPF